MKAIRGLVKDRRAAQRGSVLSGVLFMTAFIAIISGALMTELSTNFLLSHNLMTRMTNQATVNSAIESSLSQFQATPLNSGCPSLQSVNLNSSWATPAYTSCWPTVDVRSPQFNRIASSSGTFSIDGTHPQLSGLNDYVVGNAAGTVFDYRFGSKMPRWTLSLGGSLTGPPLVMPNPDFSSQFLVLIPLSGPACSPFSYCLNVRSDDNTAKTPSLRCTIAASGGAVLSQPVASPGIGGFAYYADGGSLEVKDFTAGECESVYQVTIPGGQRVMAGPIAFRCVNGCGSTADELYAVVSDNVSSRLVSYRSSGQLTFSSSLALPWGSVSGIAISSNTLPASMVITFDGGGVALVRISTSGGMTLANSISVPGGITDAPYWCTQCGNLVGVGARNGGLYLFDSSLNPFATPYVVAAPIRTTPSADGAGTWYFGADDGYVHEVQVQAGPVMTQVTSYGVMGQAGSSVQVGGCSIGICVYLGAVDSNLYLVPLDARDIVITACITTSASSPCSGATPRLTAKIEVGAAGNPNAVHVRAWSYSS